jgi:hypothetical protein
MSQYNLFTGEIEAPVIYIEPEVEPEILEPPEPPKLSKKHRKDFQIGKCKRCGQLLLDDPENTRIKWDDELCEDCDSVLRAKYAQFKNFALIRALRAHKNINR